MRLLAKCEEKSLVFLMCGGFLLVLLLPPSMQRQNIFFVLFAFTLTRQETFTGNLGMKQAPASQQACRAEVLKLISQRPVFSDRLRSEVRNIIRFNEPTFSHATCRINVYWSNCSGMSSSAY